MSIRKKKIAVVSAQCVACGCCARVCPLTAITVSRGITAVVDQMRCVGCGKCAAVCPACVISIEPASDCCSANEVDPFAKGSALVEHETELSSFGAGNSEHSAELSRVGADLPESKKEAR